MQIATFEFRQGSRLVDSFLSTLVLFMICAWLPQAMVTMKSLPIIYDGKRNARFGVIPKRPSTIKEVQWFEVEPCMIFHVTNAWQDGADVIKLYACAFQDVCPRRFDRFHGFLGMNRRQLLLRAQELGRPTKVHNGGGGVESCRHLSVYAGSITSNCLFGSSLLIPLAYSTFVHWLLDAFHHLLTTSCIQGYN